MNSYLDCADRSVGGRRTIDVIDQTLRDGPQSWWGMRMTKSIGLPIAAELDRTGAILRPGQVYRRRIAYHFAAPGPEQPWTSVIAALNA